MAVLSPDALVDRVKAFDSSADEELLRRAYAFGAKYHEGQLRASGEPFFDHPIAVAEIVIQLELDWETVVTALLHDVVEDTDATIEQVSGLFGETVADLIDGVTKLSQIELTDEVSKSAENFRKLFLAMSKDIRVLMVKLCDRLHNMRTLGYVKPEKRARKSRETLEIYAPLAERIGMERMKEELTDLAFTHLNGDARREIVVRLEQISGDNEKMRDQIVAELEQTLYDARVPSEVNGRIKAPYSIWQKMQRKEVAFEQLADIMAFRVVVDDRGACYQALGILHDAYSVVPGRFKDYISTPKKNGYQSIHTGLVGPARQKIEVQIRTKEMHQVNEFGVAAHWAYKEGAGRVAEQDNATAWVRNLLEVVQDAESPDEFIEHTKLEMYRDSVFCFTPNGRLIGLPAGATPVDFAYQVHSAVGDKCVGAKINGRIRPLQTVLCNGDQLEILTNKNSQPSPDWETFVVTAKARAAVRKFKRQSERDQYVELGRKMLEKAARSVERELPDKLIDSVLNQFQRDERDDLFADVGAGLTQTREVIHALFPEIREEAKRAARNQTTLGQAQARAQVSRRGYQKRGNQKSGKDQPMSISGLIPGMAVHYARCCHPLPGDAIVGIVQTGRGVTVHAKDCDTLERFHDEPERWLAVGWNDDSEEGGNSMIGRLSITILNEPGSLGDVSNVIGKNNGNISNLRMVSRTSDFFEMLVDVEVADKAQLYEIMAALRSHQKISEVSRARG